MGSRLLSDICEVRKETCAPNESPNSVYIGLEHIDSGRFAIDRQGSPNDVKSTKNKFYPGDILYGKLRPYLDKAVVAETEGICSTDIVVLKPLNVPSWFLCGIVHTDSFFEHAKKTTKGVNHPRTSWRGIQNFEILTFSQTEQSKIAAIIFKIQKAIELQNKIIKSLRDLKKSTMQHLFTYGLHGEKTKTMKYGEIPQSWKIMPLGECCMVQTGVTKGRMVNEHESVELPYLRVANVQDGYLDLSEMKTIRIRKTDKKRYLLQEGDVVLTEGGDFDKLGRGFVWEGQVADCVHQNHIFAVRSRHKNLNPRYLAYLVQSSYGKRYFLRVAHKTTNLACINATKLKNFPIAIPDENEQEEIVKLLNKIDTKIKEHEIKRNALNGLFKTTLNKLITGEISVQDMAIDNIDCVERKT